MYEYFGPGEVHAGAGIVHCALTRVVQSVAYASDIVLKYLISISLCRGIVRPDVTGMTGAGGSLIEKKIAARSMAP